MKVFQLIKKISEPVKIVVDIKTLHLSALFSRAVQGDERYVPLVVGTDVIVLGMAILLLRNDHSTFYKNTKAVKYQSTW